jgi:hypothetical protein
MVRCDADIHWDFLAAVGFVVCVFELLIGIESTPCLRFWDVMSLLAAVDAMQASLC